MPRTDLISPQLRSTAPPGLWPWRGETSTATGYHHSLVLFLPILGFCQKKNTAGASPTTFVSGHRPEMFRRPERSQCLGQRRLTGTTPCLRSRCLGVQWHQTVRPKGRPTGTTLFLISSPLMGAHGVTCTAAELSGPATAAVGLSRRCCLLAFSASFLASLMDVDRPVPCRLVRATDSRLISPNIRRLARISRKQQSLQTKASAATLDQQLKEPHSTSLDP